MLNVLRANPGKRSKTDCVDEHAQRLLAENQKLREEAVGIILEIDALLESLTREPSTQLETACRQVIAR